MQLQLQDFASMVKTQAAAASASCQLLVDTTVGSVLRAIFEANASIGLWIQWLTIQVLATTRAATSKGDDLDTWVGDFGMLRLPASPAAGTASFSRTTPGLTALVPVGALVRTGTGASDQVFVVTSDATSPKWTGLGFQVSASDTSVTVPVVAQQPGAAGNVLAGAVTLLATAIPGVDTVTNVTPMLGGLDAESDTALRVRFSGYLDSRNRGTSQAVGFAIQATRQGLSYTIAEQVDASGTTRVGHFTVTIDDGTGAPSATLIAQVSSAVDAVRPVGGTFSVRPPLVLPVVVQLNATGSIAALANVSAAVQAFIAGLPIGAPLFLTRLYQVAYAADLTVTNVSDATINGAAADFIPPVFGLIRVGSVGVSA